MRIGHSVGVFDAEGRRVGVITRRPQSYTAHCGDACVALDGFETVRGAAAWIRARVADVPITDAILRADASLSPEAL